MRTRNVEDAQLDFLVSAMHHGSFMSTRDILTWMKQQNDEVVSNIRQIPLTELKGWNYRDDRIRHESGKFFSIDGIRINTNYREVVSWDQPMVRSAQEGLMGFIVKKINGIYHFLVQAKLESGNFDVVEMAPTVQCLTGNYRKGQNEYTIPYLEQVLNAPKDKVWYASYQSEEGGRFFQEQNLNTIVEVGDEFPVEVEENYCWMTLNQMLSFVIYNNYLNIAARSLLSAISLY